MIGDRAALAVLALLRGLVTTVVLGLGFHALSDDDFSRVVIAQSFAQGPRLDPSGTSWLPAPFWLVGSVMALVGRDFLVARAVSVGLGVLATWAVYGAGRQLGLRPPAALLAAGLATVLPYSAWLGVATVPELPTAALLLLGASLAMASPGRRLLGALVLAVAALSRYEAWPVAAVYAALAIYDAARAHRDPRRAALLVAAALVASAGPIGWMMHGAVNHGSTLFFVHRVAAYRQAVGASPANLLARLTGFPVRLARCEPELALLFVVALLHRGWRRAPVTPAAGRAALLLGGVLAFLVVGDLRDGAPTHHGERTLLALWLGACVVVGAELTVALRGRRGLLWATAAVVAVGVGVYPLRPWYAGRDAFIDRRAELAVGRAARDLAGPDDELLVDTYPTHPGAGIDYGYFAVIAGFGGPARARPTDDQDPRKSRRKDPFTDPDAADFCAVREAPQPRFVAVKVERRSVVPNATERFRRGPWMLLERRPEP